MKKFGLVFLAVTFLSGCATKLPHVSQDFRIQEDEQRLWNRAQEEERVIDRSGAVVKDEELEADHEAFTRMAQAGYDAGESVKLFVHLMKGKEEENEKIKSSFFFSSHPHLEERVANFTQRAAGRREGPTGTERNPEQFLERMQKVFIENVRLDLRAGRYKSAQAGARKILQQWPEEGEAYYFLGEILQQRGEEGDSEEAKSYYWRASAHAPSLAEAYRGLGLLLFKEGDKASARKAFEQYLMLSPDAKDRTHIDYCLEQCR